MAEAEPSWPALLPSFRRLKTLRVSSFYQDLSVLKSCRLSHLIIEMDTMRAMPIVPPILSLPHLTLSINGGKRFTQAALRCIDLTGYRDLVQLDLAGSSSRYMPVYELSELCTGTPPSLQRVVLGAGISVSFHDPMDSLNSEQPYGVTSILLKITALCLWNSELSTPFGSLAVYTKLEALEIGTIRGRIGALPKNLPNLKIVSYTTYDGNFSSVDIFVKTAVAHYSSSLKTLIVTVKALPSSSDFEGEELSPATINTLLHCIRLEAILFDGCIFEFTRDLGLLARCLPKLKRLECLYPSERSGSERKLLVSTISGPPITTCCHTDHGYYVQAEMRRQELPGFRSEHHGRLYVSIDTPPRAHPTCPCGVTDRRAFFCNVDRQNHFEETRRLRAIDPGRCCQQVVLEDPDIPPQGEVEHSHEDVGNEHGDQSSQQDEPVPPSPSPSPSPVAAATLARPPLRRSARRLETHQRSSTRVEVADSDDDEAVLMDADDMVEESDDSNAYAANGWKRRRI